MKLLETKKLLRPKHITLHSRVVQSTEEGKLSILFKSASSENWKESYQNNI